LQVIDVEQIIHLATKDEGYGDKNACVDVIVNKQALEKNNKLQFLFIMIIKIRRLITRF
jgi:hypothetical protein